MDGRTPSPGGQDRPPSQMTMCTFTFRCIGWRRHAGNVPKAIDCLPAQPSRPPPLRISVRGPVRNENDPARGKHTMLRKNATA